MSEQIITLDIPSHANVVDAQGRRVTALRVPRVDGDLDWAEVQPVHPPLGTIHPTN